MTFGWRVSKQHRAVIVSGYIRNINIPNIPQDLHKLCLLFYDVIIDWKIENKDMKKFIECKFDESMNGPSFVVKQIPFQLKVYPNGCGIDANAGYVQLVLCCGIAKLPPHILSYNTYLELFCFETKYQFRKMINCANGRNYSCQWYRCSTLLRSLKSKKLTQLNFGCVVEILSVEHNHKLKNKVSRYIQIIQPIRMKRRCYYTWTLNKTELELFKCSGVDSSLYSPNFNHGCWCIVFVPNGWSWKKKTQNHLFAKVKLLKLPFGIKTIEIKTVFLIKLDRYSDGWTYSKKCDATNPGRVDMKLRIKVKTFRKCAGELSISLTMQIVKMYDHNDQEIDPTNWMSYCVCA